MSCSIFTVTKCDECSFAVRLYATATSHTVPSVKDLEDQSYCILDLKLRKRLRALYPGACALEFESTMQIVVGALLGWDKKKGTGTNGLFGKVIAYADACEEQARYTLHSHMCIWIKDFNKVQDLIFHDNILVREKARVELKIYFEKISQASFGDLQISTKSGPDEVVNITQLKY